MFLQRIGQTTEFAMRQLTLALMFLLPCSLAFATEFVRPRPLTEYADILLAQELDTAINALNNHMSQCVDSGVGNPSECNCRYAEEAKAAEASYEKVLQARPKWKGKVLFWKDTQNLASYYLIMPAVESLLQSPAQGCGTTPRH